ncbi:reverse transcriptase domain-containing protein [Tanacetum coccineum]
MLKFPVKEGIITLRSSPIIPVECRMPTEASNEPSPNELVISERIKVSIHPEYPEQTVTIGGRLSEKGRMELCDLLRNNLDIFGWKLPDMIGVPRSVSELRLNIHEGCPPIRHKRRGQEPDRNNSHHVGIKACPEKAEAVMKLHSPRTLKERGNQRDPVNRKSLKANANLFCQPCATGSKNQLQPNGKTNTGPNTLLKKTEKILPGTHDHSCYRPANQANPITTRKCQKNGEIALRTIVIRHQLQAANIYPRQVLADFIAQRPKEDTPPAKTPSEEEVQEPCTIFTDGSSCLEGSRAELILTNPEGTEFTYALRFKFDASNNEAKYEALMAGLRIAKQMDVKNLVVKVDSCLVANQINGSYIAKEQSMIQYPKKVKVLISNFKKFSIEQVPRSEYKKADALSQIASTSFAHLTNQVLVEVLKEKSIEEKEIIAVVEEEGYSWMTPMFEYLTRGEQKKPNKLKRTEN